MVLYLSIVSRDKEWIKSGARVKFNKNYVFKGFTKLENDDSEIADELYNLKHLLAHMTNKIDYEHFAEVYIKEFYQKFRNAKNMT